MGLAKGIRDIKGYPRWLLRTCRHSNKESVPNLLAVLKPHRRENASSRDYDAPVTCRLNDTGRGRSCLKYLREGVKRGNEGGNEVFSQLRARKGGLTI